MAATKVGDFVSLSRANSLEVAEIELIRLWCTGMIIILTLAVVINNWI